MTNIDPSVALDELKARIAQSKGLPPDLAARLRGQTEEELAADADSLRALIDSTPGVPRASLTQGQPERGTWTPAPSMNDRIRAAADSALYKQGSSVIGPDPDSINDRIRRAAGYTKEST